MSTLKDRFAGWRPLVAEPVPAANADAARAQLRASLALNPALRDGRSTEEMFVAVQHFRERLGSASEGTGSSGGTVVPPSSSMATVAETVGEMITLCEQDLSSKTASLTAERGAISVKKAQLQRRREEAVLAARAQVERALAVVDPTMRSPKTVVMLKQFEQWLKRTLTTQKAGGAI